MNLYLSALFSRRDELLEYAKILKDKGHHITSSWLNEIPSRPYSRYAAADVVDLHFSDKMLAFTNKLGGTYPGGGRHVEFGMALAWSIPVDIIGEREHVFHYLQPTRVFCSFKEWLNEHP